MFTRRKLIDILSISLLISFALFISFFNLISDEPAKENLGATVLFLLVFTVVAVIAYILKNKTLTIFISSYFALITLCFATGLIGDLFDAEYGAVYFICSIVVSPFYGFIYTKGLFIYLSFIFSVANGALSGFFAFLLVKKTKNNSQK
ncbi:MAG: hypothetical protein IJ303_02955 [Clostridia bacterium]|nr:hypothetical protein [Clostridia bacterium]